MELLENNFPPRAGLINGIEIKPSISSSKKKRILLPRSLVKMHALSDGLRIFLKEISIERMSRNLNVFKRAPGNFTSNKGAREKIYIREI